jgi:hypothetical protein
MLYMFQAVSPLAATASVGEFQLTHVSGSSKQAWHIPDAVCTVFELLMMGGETAWNMQSIDSNKEYWVYLKEYINDARSRERKM